MSGRFSASCPRCRAPFDVLIRDVRIVHEDEHMARLLLDLTCCGQAVMPVPSVDLDAFIMFGLPAPLEDHDVIEFQMHMVDGDCLAGVAEMEMSE